MQHKVKRNIEVKQELPDRYFFNKNRTVKLAQLLKGIIPRGKGSKRNTVVRDAWRQTVGEEICNNTEITEFKNSVLYVNVESSALIHHLTNFEKIAIIDKLNTIMGAKSIGDIRFKVGTVNKNERR